MSDSILDGNGLIYVQVRERLQDQISSLEEGAKLPSERELSERFKVDRATVRRAMKDLVTEGYIIRYTGKGTYVRKLPTTTSAETQSKIVALVIADEDTPFQARIIKGVQTRASAERCHLLLCQSLADNEREKQLLEDVRRMDIDRLLLVPYMTDSYDPSYSELISRLLDSGMRIVTVDQYLLEPEVPCVITDKVQTGYAATEHLIMLGHKRIGYACTASYDVSGRDCLRGYRMALDDYGLEFSEDLVIDVPGRYCAVSARDAIIGKLTRNPRAFTAIAAPFYGLTHGVMTAMADLGRRMPEDMAFVGADVYHNPAYSHVTHTLQPAQEMGEEALALVLRDNDDQVRKRNVLMKPRLVVGETCGKKSKHA